MKNEKIICEQCGYEANIDDVFCAFCGRNLKIPIKPIQEIIPPEEFDIDIIKTKGELLTKYQQLSTQLEEFEGVDDKLHQQREYYNSLINEVNKAREFYEQRRSQTDMELKDVRSLQKLTWKSIKARIKGEREELLKKEEIEHLAALNREEAAKKDLEELNKRLKNAEDQLNELILLSEQKRKLELQLVKVVDTACEGVTDPIEDQIEADLRNLYSQRSPLFNQINQFKTALGHLFNAKTHFERALDELRSAKGFSDWDTFFGGGLLVDSVKHSRVADARNSVQQAHRSAERAYALIPNMPRIQDAYIEEGSFLWDSIFDNIFSDLKARDRIMRSRNSVENAYSSTINSINWTNSNIGAIEQKFDQLEQKIKVKRKQLTEERRRMIEQAIQS